MIRRPNHERDLARAKAIADNAVSVFQSLADSLEASAHEAKVVADRAHEDAQRFAAIRDEADVHAQAAQRQANKVKELLQ